VTRNSRKESGNSVDAYITGKVGICCDIARESLALSKNAALLKLEFESREAALKAHRNPPVC
jgi:hypothetical protein